MAPPNHLTPANDFDIEEMLFEAQHRWLRTPEICEILRNYKRFNIAPEPPNMPPSGSLFLFDRKVLRYFRKDGHRWRKKKDGKTIREAHERLKAGSIDVLHCYYAHGEDNEKFQRRSYWMLEEKLSHIVLVHYREVKGYKTNFNRFKETEEAIAIAPETEQGVCHSEAENSINSGLQQKSCQVTSHNTVSRISNGAQASDYEGAESGSFQAKSTSVSSLEIDEDHLLQKRREEFESWERDDVLESHNVRVQSASVKPYLFDVQSYSLHDISKQKNVLAMHLLTDPVCESQASRDLVQGLKNQQVSGEDAMHFGSACTDTFMPNLHDHAIIDSLHMDRQNLDTMDHVRNQPSVSACLEGQSDVKSNLTVAIKSSRFSASRTLLKRPVKEEVLEKCVSFSQRMCKEVGDVEPVMISSGAYWDADDKRSDRPILLPVAEFDSYTHGPSLSQGQLFRIIDFAPNWGYASSETKVLITGEFLTTQPDTRKYQWSCMFGEMEVPAQVIADGVLCCYAPPHGVARVHFYVTCSNRIACSDVREFEYRGEFTNSFDSTSLSNRCDALQVGLCKLLSLGSTFRQNTQPCNGPSSSNLHHEICLLFKGIGSEWFQILELTSKEKFSLDEVKDKLAEKFMKEKLYEWLLFKEAEGGNGLRGLDENGQGALHLAAALGYNWAISPLVVAGVSINFRDIRGWTALHWAAYHGRERTVAYLIYLGAYAGALTDPTPTNPMGRTPADLASEHGHKGISGFLAESALSAHLESLTLKNKNKHNIPVEPHEMASVSTASERMASVATPVSGGDIDGLSLKDSLAALRNATQAAARIHQVYRSHSFRKKLMSEFDSDKIESSDEYAISVITLNTRKQGQHDEPVHAAAVRIQNKFRSWKGRREFLTLRKKIVQIQAHIRGHQVRKHYKTFVWSVGIVEKVILRWRRRRSGLRGFKSEYSTVEGTSLKDDYDFLKQGRKQAEERLQKALTRVKSMVHYPEAREQYRRLLTTVQQIKEMKDGCSGAIDGTFAIVTMEDDLIDLDTLLNDGTNQ